MTVEELIAKCRAVNETFEHVVEDIDGGIRIASRAVIAGAQRELSLELPTERLSRRASAETYQLEQCLRALEAASSGSKLVDHIPGAPPAEQCGTPVS